jgi:hypothetical protein
MVEHVKSADQIVAEAIAIHIDTEGLSEVEVAGLEDMLYWALDQVGVI